MCFQQENAAVTWCVFFTSYCGWHRVFKQINAADTMSFKQINAADTMSFKQINAADTMSFKQINAADTMSFKQINAAGPPCVFNK